MYSSNHSRDSPELDVISSYKDYKETIDSKISENVADRDIFHEINDEVDLVESKLDNMKDFIYSIIQISTGQDRVDLLSDNDEATKSMTIDTNRNYALTSTREQYNMKDSLHEVFVDEGYFVDLINKSDSVYHKGLRMIRNLIQKNWDVIEIMQDLDKKEKMIDYPVEKGSSHYIGIDRINNRVVASSLDEYRGPSHFRESSGIPEIRIDFETDDVNEVIFILESREELSLLFTSIKERLKSVKEVLDSLDDLIGEFFGKELVSQEL